MAGIKAAGAASWASVSLAIMAGTAALPSMNCMSTETPYFSKLPVALAIHNGANAPLTVPYETTSLRKAPVVAAGAVVGGAAVGAGLGSAVGTNASAPVAVGAAGSGPTQ